MINPKDWKEYTRQIDLRDEQRAKADALKRERWYIDLEIRQKKEYAKHIADEEMREKRASETRTSYIPSLFRTCFEIAPMYVYFNDRTVESCLDWIVAGRPTIADKIEVK